MYLPKVTTRVVKIEQLKDTTTIFLRTYKLTVKKYARKSSNLKASAPNSLQFTLVSYTEQININFKTTFNAGSAYCYCLESVFDDWISNLHSS